MSTKYTFIAVSDNGKQEIVVTETTDSETWGAPLELFFRFLKGNGYLFDIEEELAVYNNSNGECRTANFL